MSENLIVSIVGILVTIAFAFIGAVIWAIRQEGKLAVTEKRLDAGEKRLAHVETQVELIDSTVMREIACLRETMARIEGYLKARCDAGDCRGTP